MYMCYAWDPWMFMIIYVWLCVKLTPSGLWWTAYLFVWMGRRRTRVVVNCLSGFGDFIYGCMLILWHVYFGDVWFISAATIENFYKCMLYDICWRCSVYFLNKCFIRVFYRFNRNRTLQKTQIWENANANPFLLFVHFFGKKVCVLRKCL